MRIVVALLLLVSASIPASAQTTSGQRAPLRQPDNFVGGKHYKTMLTDEEVASTPIWDDAQSTPPVTPRAAVLAARDCLRGLHLPITEWEVSTIELQPVGRDGHWLYQVRFMEHRDDREPGLRTGFEVTVLMNGVAVVPKLIDR